MKLPDGAAQSTRNRLYFDNIFYAVRDNEGAGLMLCASLSETTDLRPRARVKFHDHTFNAKTATHWAEFESTEHVLGIANAVRAQVRVAPTDPKYALPLPRV
jgi:hypothetical protein